MRDRRGEILFIDARKLGRMEGRVNRVFDDADIEKIGNAVHAWRNDISPRPQAGEGAGVRGDDYHDIPGFCRAVKLDEVADHGYVLTPGRYVGSEAVEDDDEAFADKMATLTAKLSEQMAKANELDAVIRERLGKLGYVI